MKKLSGLAGLLGCIAILIGCGGGSSNSNNQPLVGYWKVRSLATDPNNPMPCPTILTVSSTVGDQCSGNDVYNFRSDGTYALTTVGSSNIVESGTYSANGSTLTTTQKVTSNGTTTTIVTNYSYTVTAGQLLTLTCTSQSPTPQLVGIIITTVKE